MTKDTIQDFVDTLGYVPILNEGEHIFPEDGACVMEMVSYLHDGSWTDYPSCTMKAISQLAQRVNDTLPDTHRYLILSQFDRLFGTSKIDSSMMSQSTFFKLLLPVSIKWAKVAEEQGLESSFYQLAKNRPELWGFVQDTMKNFLSLCENDPTGLVARNYPSTYENTDDCWNEIKALRILGTILDRHDLTPEQRVEMLSDVLDVADVVLERKESTPTDKTRLKNLQALRPTIWTEVKHGSA